MSEPNPPSGYWFLETIWKGVTWTAMGCGSAILMITAPGQLFADAADAVGVPDWSRSWADVSDDAILPMAGGKVLEPDIDFQLYATRRLTTLQADDAKRGGSSTAHAQKAIKKFGEELDYQANKYRDGNLYRGAPPEDLLKSFKSVRKSLSEFYASGSDEEKDSFDAFKLLAHTAFDAFRTARIQNKELPNMALHAAGRSLAKLLSNVESKLFFLPRKDLYRNTFNHQPASNDQWSAAAITKATGRFKVQIEKILGWMKTAADTRDDKDLAKLATLHFYEIVERTLIGCLVAGVDHGGREKKPLDRRAWLIGQLAISTIATPHVVETQDTDISLYWNLLDILNPVRMPIRTSTQNLSNTALAAMEGTKGTLPGSQGVPSGGDSRMLPQSPRLNPKAQRTTTGLMGMSTSPGRTSPDLASQLSGRQLGTGLPTTDTRYGLTGRETANPVTQILNRFVETDLVNFTFDSSGS